MRYPASEKLEIIRIVEHSHLPARRTLEQLGIARRTFCRWYDRYLDGGPEALEDRPSVPSRVWNRIAQGVGSAMTARHRTFIFQGEVVQHRFKDHARLAANSLRINRRFRQKSAQTLNFRQ